ncbi:peptidoglycan-binding protein [Streptomyces sp. NRRL S-87]|uniref:peptidoglycan-binding domain-containing protein n=1 Tax=Streptomyces sp. NRRL S-87 TaxID=1463920 RepID=UPI00068F43DE|nr:peptidoglycan-binding domain-containing protein [Streptomyces sp. NRRL S-87]
MMKKLAVVAAGAALLAVVAPASSASAATELANCGRFSTQEPVLRYGATGPAVKALQCELSSAIYGMDLEFDGIFGQKTYNAVIKFQGRECANIDVDGVVGPITWAQLDRWNNNSHFAC